MTDRVKVLGSPVTLTLGSPGGVKKKKTEFSCLSDRFFSSSRKLVSATVFLPNIFSPAAGWLTYELHLGILFSLKKLSGRHYLVASLSLFETVLWVKKEFPNVTCKLISPPQAKKKFGENTVAETSFRKNWKFNFFLKNEKKKKTIRDIDQVWENDFGMMRNMDEGKK